MWAQWLERTLNVHDAAAYAVRRRAVERAVRSDETTVWAATIDPSSELDPGQLMLVVEEMHEP